MMKPNILLVVMDSVRAANTTLHGHERDTTPFLEEFAADTATNYTQTRSPGVWTLPSHVSMFTGFHVDEHGITTHTDELVPGCTIWDSLKQEHGYRTGVFSENPFLTDLGTGIEACFDDAVSIHKDRLPFSDAVDPLGYEGELPKFIRHSLADRTPFRSLLNGFTLKFEEQLPKAVRRATGRQAPPAQTCVDRFLEWRESKTPWAACLNFMDAHWPYDPTPEHMHWGSSELQERRRSMSGDLWSFEGGQRDWTEWESMELLYDDTIRQIDAQLRRLVSGLERQGELDDTLVIVTSDHGEAFGEPSHVRPDVRVREHGSGALHEAVTHVPLVIKQPGQDDGRSVSSLASLTRLPSVIEQAVDGATGSSPLIAEETALMSTHGISREEEKYQTASNYCEDPWQYTGHGQIAYTQTGEKLRKFVRWRTDQGTYEMAFDISETGTLSEVDVDPKPTLQDCFDGLTNAGIKRSNREEQIGATTKQRLDDLGYL